MRLEEDGVGQRVRSQLCMRYVLERDPPSWKADELDSNPMSVHLLYSAVR